MQDDAEVTKRLGSDWSGRRESNPCPKLGKLNRTLKNVRIGGICDVFRVSQMDSNWISSLAARNQGGRVQCKKRPASLRISVSHVLRTLSKLIVLPCYFEVLICFDDLPAAFDPDFDVRAPGILPIRGSPASTSSHARSAADSKSGASTGKTCQPVTRLPNT
jgi:hypothetical protein